MGYILTRLSILRINVYGSTVQKVSIHIKMVLKAGVQRGACSMPVMDSGLWLITKLNLSVQYKYTHVVTHKLLASREAQFQLVGESHSLTCQYRLFLLCNILHNILCKSNVSFSFVQISVPFLLQQMIHFIMKLESLNSVTILYVELNQTVHN